MQDFAEVCPIGGKACVRNFNSDELARDHRRGANLPIRHIAINKSSIRDYTD
jgi:hypothetical protein